MNKFIEFIDKLNIEDKYLEEAIINGYLSIFENLQPTFGADNSPWKGFFGGTRLTPLSNMMGDPIGNYRAIMKQEPSTIGALGGNPENGPSNNQYHASLPKVSRDIRKETINNWNNAPKIPRIHNKQNENIKKIINNAQNHIPIPEHKINVAPITRGDTSSISTFGLGYSN